MANAQSRRAFWVGGRVSPTVSRMSATGRGCLIDAGNRHECEDSDGAIVGVGGRALSSPLAANVGCGPT